MMAAPMSGFWAIYGLASLLLLAVINSWLWRRRKRNRVTEIDNEDGAARTDTASAGFDPEAVPGGARSASLRHRRSPVSAYSPIPQPSKLLMEMAEELGAAELAGNAAGSAAAAVSRQTRAELHVGRLLTVLMLGAFVAILNQTLINVAIPHMMNDLNVSASVIQWLVTGYMLMNGVMIPITAFLIERFGSRIMFLAAMMLFTAGALVCAVAPNFPIMLTGRIVQASGAGIIMPLMMTVFLTVFPPEQRGKAMGMMGIAMIFAPAIGPTLSGWIVQTYSWRLLFYVVIPIGLLDLLLAFAWMGNVTKQSKVSFDLWGAVFSTVGFGGILYSFSEAGSAGWGSLRIIGMLTIGTIALLLFVWRELTVRQPMLDLRVFTYDVFTMTTIISSIINMAMFAAMILLPIYLQNIRGFSPLQSGLLLLPGAILMGIMQPIAGAIFDKTGARWLAVIGLLITTVTTWEFTKLTAETSYGHMLLLYCMRMFGMSFMMMTIMTEGMNQLPRSLHSHGTAMSNTLRQVAGSLGTALLVTIMTSRSTMHMGGYQSVVTAANPYIATETSALGHAVAGLEGLPAQAGAPLLSLMLYGNAMKESTIAGINDAFLIATGITVVALALAFFIRRVKPVGRKDPDPA